MTFMYNMEQCALYSVCCTLHPSTLFPPFSLFGQYLLFLIGVKIALQYCVSQSRLQSEVKHLLLWLAQLWFSPPTPKTTPCNCIILQLESYPPWFGVSLDSTMTLPLSPSHHDSFLMYLVYIYIFSIYVFFWRFLINSCSGGVPCGDPAVTMSPPRAGGQVQS